MCTKPVQKIAKKLKALDTWVQQVSHWGGNEKSTQGERKIPNWKTKAKKILHRLKKDLWLSLFSRARENNSIPSDRKKPGSQWNKQKEENTSQENAGPNGEFKTNSQDSKWPRAPGETKATKRKGFGPGFCIPASLLELEVGLKCRNVKWQLKGRSSNWNDCHAARGSLN